MEQIHHKLNDISILADGWTILAAIGIDLDVSV